MRLRCRTRLALAASVVVALAVAACSSSGRAPAAAPASTLPSPGAQIRVATNDIVLGPNRLLFAVTTSEGRPMGEADVALKFFYKDGPEPDAVKSETEALYLGSDTPTARALYSVRANLDKTGLWEVEATVRRSDEAPMTARTGFRVKAVSDMPNVGDAALASINQTLKDAPIEQLTSARPPGDPDFYRLTIADALAEHKPLLVVFSTPAFCQTQTCGPQLDAAQALKRRYGDRMNFIHIEIFRRPDLLLENKAEPEVSSTVREWRLQTEPDVFLIDGSGKIRDRFEGFASKEELEASVRALVGG